MSPLRHHLDRLDTTRKWLLLSCGILALSTLMPWYEDVDEFHAGERFLGITGPLFLFGTMILLSALLIGWMTLRTNSGRRFPNLPISESVLYMVLGLQDLFLLFLANSVFFHPKFGVNIAMKSTGLGMVFAFIGVILMIWTSYRLHLKTTARSSTIDSEPLIKMPESTLERTRPPFEPSRNATLERRGGPVASDETVQPKPQALRMDL